MMGISLSLMFLLSGAETATADDNFYQPLSFHSTVNPISPIHSDGMAFIFGTSTESIKDTQPRTTTDMTDTQVTFEKKTGINQKNSTSRRSAIVDD